MVEAISNYLFQIWGVEPPLKSLSSGISEHPGFSGLHDVHLQYLYSQGKPSQNCYLMFLGVIMSILFFSDRECRNLVRRFKEAEMYCNVTCTVQVPQFTIQFTISIDRVGYGAPPTIVADGPPPEQPPLNIVQAEDSEDQPENQWSTGRRMGVRVEAGPTTDSFPHFHCRMT